ncbi:uncharacterized protein LOC129888008 [Solanum dulcamara]|uniref:uncharacterized protein LOC129888008 n=1 Tax=Solanum dulcamara TaxID=45834 RepID=UPI0024852D65|nr:uncharacterized protein LOC129888008 [Solanum dulcamara]
MLPRGNKFDSRVRKTVLLGYEETQKGYRLFDMEAGAFLVSRDVSFRESIFPFKGAKIDLDDILCPAPAQDIHEHALPIAIDREQTMQEETNKTLPVEGVNIGESSVAELPEAVIERSDNIENMINDTTCPEEVVGAGPLHGIPAEPEDFVVSKKTANQASVFPISDFISYTNLSPNYQTYLSAFSAALEPQSFQEASKDQRWIEAMEKEIQALKENHTWNIVDLPIDK